MQQGLSQLFASILEHNSQVSATLAGGAWTVLSAVRHYGMHAAGAFQRCETRSKYQGPANTDCLPLMGPTEPLPCPATWTIPMVAD